MTKNKFFITIVLFISVIGVLIYTLLYTNLKIDNKKVTNLYSYIGNDNLTKCADDLFYLSDGASITSLSENALICNAYLNVVDKGTEEKFALEEEGSCKVGSLLLSPDNNSNECTALKYNLNDIKESYYNIYGTSLSSFETFSLQNGNVCSFNEIDNMYYCYKSASETTIDLSQSNVYRLLKSAVDVYDGTIVLKDYFLNISNNVCYIDINNNNKNYDCINFLKDNPNYEIDIKFMKKYGTLYEHTFKKDNNGEYHWIKSKKIA